jgi:hypothetical protein
MTCLKCKTAAVPPENGAKAPICRCCRAELILSGDEERLDLMDRVYADQDAGQLTPVTWSELNVLSLRRRSPFESRRIRCSICGASENYDPMVKRQGWPCERCHRHGLKCCMAFVTSESKTVSMCRFCRAELELSGQPVAETLKPLPGTEVKK